MWNENGQKRKASKGEWIIFVGKTNEEHFPSLGLNNLLQNVKCFWLPITNCMNKE